MFGGCSGSGCGGSWGFSHGGGCSGGGCGGGGGSCGGGSGGGGAGAGWYSAAKPLPPPRSTWTEIPTLPPVDMSINVAPVRAQIDNCKRRYLREVWEVLFKEALQCGGGEEGGSWKNKECKDEGDGEKEAQATSNIQEGVEKVMKEELDPETMDEDANENNRQRRLRQQQGKPQQKPQQPQQKPRQPQQKPQQPLRRLSQVQSNICRGTGCLNNSSCQRPALQRRGAMDSQTAPAARPIVRHLEDTSTEEEEDEVGYDEEELFDDESRDSAGDCNSANSVTGARRRFVPLFCGTWGTVAPSWVRRRPASAARSSIGGDGAGPRREPASRL